MVTESNTWETIYEEGRHINKYPWDIVVSFVYRNYPRNKQRNEVKIFEIGCGTGNNLWFAAREGFRVAGVDISPTAISYARNRFIQEGLEADLKVGRFSELQFDDNSFDIVLDRGAITCCSLVEATKAISEINRVLLPGGKLLLNPYSERHSSFMAGKIMEDGTTDLINDGTLIGVGKVYFYNKKEILGLFKKGWNILSLEHYELRDELNPKGLVHAEWRLIAEKII